MTFAEQLLQDAQRRVILTPEHPEKLKTRADGCFFAFARDAFGTLELELESPSPQRLELRLGEVLTPDGRIFEPRPRSPECSRRFRRFELDIPAGLHRLRLEIPRPHAGDDYQTEGYDCTAPRCIPCPPHIGEVMPFRYGEIRTGGAPVNIIGVVRLTAHYPFDDRAADFHCSDERLNTVWELCKHTIKSVTYLGAYIDGDRERLPYEGDALVQQLSHFCLDTHYELSSAAVAWFCDTGTSWCYEWVLSIPILAWRHSLYSGDFTPAEHYYAMIKTATLAALTREDGLLVTGYDCRDPELISILHPTTGFLRDVIDWPPSMRDDYESGSVNTVANSFHYAALRAVENLASALGRTEDQIKYGQEADRVRQAMKKCLYNPATGLFVDSEGSKHSSLHANMFPVAFEAVAPEPDSPIARFLASREMVCSVWGAQFFLEALFRTGHAGRALELMTSDSERGWLNMIHQGATMTMESWSDAMKPAQDWNHPWATAPANLISRHVFGIRPLTPGFDRALVAPAPGGLDQGRITVPTPHGGIAAEFRQRNGCFHLNLDLPAGVSAEVQLPDGTVREAGPGHHEFTEIIADHR